MEELSDPSFSLRLFLLITPTLVASDGTEREMPFSKIFY